MLFSDISDVIAGSRVGCRLSIDCNTARGGFDEIEQHPNDGGLAGTVGSEQSKKLSLFNCIGNIIDSGKVAKFFGNRIKYDHISFNLFWV